MALTGKIEFPAAFGKPESGGYRATPYSDLVTFKPDAGAEVVRRRTGRRGMEHRVSYLFNDVEKETFETWVEDDARGGALAFNWSDPYSSSYAPKYTVRIKPKSLRYQAISPLWVRVTMILQEVSRA